MYVTEKEMRDRLKLDSKSDLIGKLVMAYMTIRQLQEKLEGAKNTEPRRRTIFPTEEAKK